MKPAYYIIGALLLWTVFRECSRPSEPLPPSIQANKDSILVKKDRVAALEAQGLTISRKLAIDSIRHFEALKRSESRISGLTKSLAAAIRKAPTIIRDTVFLIQDSIIVQQASEIRLLRGGADSLRINYRDLIKVKDAELRIKDEMFSHMESINTELFKRLNSEKRKGKVAKVLIPVALVLGFILGEEL